MEITASKSIKSDPIPIKKEPGVFVKSELEPSLASLPMAPTFSAKKESGDDKKPIFGSIPERRGQGRRNRRRDARYHGNSITHNLDGYAIHAHYGKGKVNYTVVKNTDKMYQLKWDEVEGEIFRKLRRRAKFDLEPLERPGPSLTNFCSGGAGRLRFSLEVRRFQPGGHAQSRPTASSGYGALFGGQPGLAKEKIKGEKHAPMFGSGSSSTFGDFGSHSSSIFGDVKPKPEEPNVSLPPNPSVPSTLKPDGGTQLFSFGGSLFGNHANNPSLPSTTKPEDDSQPFSFGGSLFSNH